MTTSHIVNQPGEFGAQVSPHYTPGSGAREEGAELYGWEPLGIPSEMKSEGERGGDESPPLHTIPDRTMPYPTSPNLTIPHQTVPEGPVGVRYTNYMADLGKFKALPPLSPDHDPVLAVDLDGTLADTPPKSTSVPLLEIPPKPGAVEAMQAFYDQGWTLILWTCRDSYDEIREWLHLHKIPYHHINYRPDQPSSSPKLEADYYIDNRAIRPDNWEHVKYEVLAAQKARQPVSSHSGYAALVQLGEQARPEFANILQTALGFPLIELDEGMDLGEHLSNEGGVTILAPNKAEERATEKVNTDYEGDWSRLLDMVRAAVAVDSWDELRQAVAKLDNAGLVLARNPKNRFAQPRASGYRDFLANYRLPSGAVVEVQFHLKPFLRTREQVKQNYETVRKIRALMQEEGRDSLTPDEIATVNELRNASQSMYQQALEECLQNEGLDYSTKQMPMPLGPLQGQPPEDPPSVPPSPYMFLWHR